MALQDLTPQLRTRLSRMERAVGWFVILAMLLLGFGFFYYLYDTANRKGWFLTKATYFTFTDSASGIKEGDPVELMGSDVGQITVIKPMPAEQFTYNIYIEFELRAPHYDYIWTQGSRARINAGLLDKRTLEVTRGTGGYPVYVFFPMRTNVPLPEAVQLPEASRWVLAEEVYDHSGSNLIAQPFQSLTNLNLAALEAAGKTEVSILDTRERRRHMTGVWRRRGHAYQLVSPGTKPYWLEADEAPALSDRLDRIVSQVEKALPNILSLTNQLTLALSNSVNLTSNLNQIAVAAQPTVSNLALISSQLTGPGTLGQWLIPTNLNGRLEGTLDEAHGTLAGANTNLVILAQDLDHSLQNLALITSNLNTQVQVNTNILSSVSQTVTHADEFIQGLKRHWLLRSAFKTKATNAPAFTPSGSLKH